MIYIYIYIDTLGVRIKWWDPTSSASGAGSILGFSAYRLCSHGFLVSCQLLTTVNLRMDVNLRTSVNLEIVRAVTPALPRTAFAPMDFSSVVNFRTIGNLMMFDSSSVRGDQGSRQSAKPMWGPIAVTRGLGLRLCSHEFSSVVNF